MVCKYLSKKINGNLYCKLKKEEIKKDCFNCPLKEYCIKNDKINIKKKNYKISKQEKNRFSLFTNDLTKCYLCPNDKKKPKEELHEVIFGKNRLNSMKYGLVIPLCLKCHDKVHLNYVLDSNLKKQAQELFEEKYDLDFLSIFHKNYK